MSNGIKAIYQYKDYNNRPAVQRLIVPMGSPEDTVERLLADITLRFKHHMATDLQFVSLSSGDFLIDNKDKIKDVLAPGDVVTVQDVSDWIRSEESYLEKAALEVSLSDYETSRPYFCSVGLTKRNTIFVRMRIGPYSTPDKQSLTYVTAPFPEKSDNNFIARLNLDNEKGFVRAVWAFDQEGNRFIDVQVDTPTSLSLSCDRIKAEVVNNQLVLGKPVQIQGAFPKVQKIYILPEANSTGPTLEALSEVQPPEKVITSEKSKGDSAIHFEQTEATDPDESWKSNGAFNNCLWTPIRISNDSQNPVTIVEANGFYKNKSGEWVPLDNTFLGSKSGYYRYSRHHRPYNLTIHPQSTELYAIEAVISIKDMPQPDTSRRIHSSLPHPLVLKFVLTDNHKATTELEITAYNRKLSFPTRQEREEDAKHKFDWWLQVDDVTACYRSWVGMYHEKEKGYLDIRMRGKNVYLYQSAVHNALYRAVKEKKTEIDIPEFQHDQEQISVKMYLMVDLEALCGYGLHLEMKTSTSSLHAYRNLPTEI